MNSILFIVAHPDDLAFGMGGTALLMKEKFKLHIFCATRGERGMKKTHTMSEAAAIREKEEIAAAKMLDGKLTFLDMIDREVMAGKDACEKTAALLAGINPRAVFTLWPIDSHPDHSAVSELTKKAIFIAEINPELYFGEMGLGIQTTSFTPNIYVNVSDVMDKKNELLRCHQSQNQEDFLVKGSIAQHAARGRECGCAYAEGFKTVLPVTNQLRSVLFEI